MTALLATVLLAGVATERGRGRCDERHGCGDERHDGRDGRRFRDLDDGRRHHERRLRRGHGGDRRYRDDDAARLRHRRDDASAGRRRIDRAGER